MGDPDGLDALLAAFRAYDEEKRNPPIRPMYSSMSLMNYGNRMVEVFRGLERGNINSVAPVSVFRMSFVPDLPEDLRPLLHHVTNAVEALARINPEFSSPRDAASIDTAYRRPYFYDQEKTVVANAYVYEEDGRVIVAAPLILSDIKHVYHKLQGILIPSAETAQQFEQARWSELRGPLSALDDRRTGVDSRYIHDAVLPEHQLGCLPDATSETLVPMALKHAISLRIAGESTDEELVQQVCWLASLTAQGALTDGSGRYPALPAPDENLSAAQYQRNIAAEVTARASEMLQDALRMAGQTSASSIGEALETAAATLGADMWDALNRQFIADRAAYNEEMDQKDKGAEKPRGGLFDSWVKALERQARETEIRKNALDGVKNENFEAQVPPFFLPRTYTWVHEGFFISGEKVVTGTSTYRSHPPGFPPVVELPDDLKPFIPERAAPTPTAQKLLTPPPSPGPE